MYLLLLAGFSNYNNRTIRKAATPDDYAYSSTGHWYITEDKAPYGLLSVNFKPNDGVSTTQVINNWLSSEYGHEPDYLIAFDNTDTSTECIVSRWYILEIRQNRGGQHELVLRRDLIADYYEPLKTADVFIERGLCNDDDPLIFNDEGMNLNKVKEDEILLKDKTEIAWIVGYKSPKNVNSVETTFYQQASLTISDLSAKTGISETMLTNMLAGNDFQVMIGWWSFIYSFTALNGARWADEAYLSQDCTSGMGLNRFQSGWLGNAPAKMFSMPTLNPNVDFYGAYRSVVAALINQPTLRQTLLAAVGANSNCITEDQYNALLTIDQPVLYDGLVYDISVGRDGDTLLYPPNQMVSSYSDLATALTQMSSLAYPIEEKYPDTAQFRVAGRFANARLSKTISKLGSITANVGGPSKNIITNRGYQMFVLPYGRYGFADDGSVIDYIESDGEISKAIVAQLIEQSDIYDIQLLPYCPVMDPLKIHPHLSCFFDLSTLVEGEDFDYIKKGTIETPTDEIGLIFYPSKDSGSILLNYEFMVDGTPKYDSNAKMMRICSPNYQGSFDFSVAKNKGVRYFWANYTYKPFTPFIRVSPEFDGLYGQEFNDQRGLICGGNFSFTKIDDKWYDYELQNKNYQNIFNREIQSLDIRQSIQMRNQIIGSATGSMVGGVQGGQAGLELTGSPWGAAAGAIVGTGVSALGGVVDVNTLAKLQKDERSLSVDKFNYTLGNIKALPTTLTQIDAFDISSKIWPFLEEYGPTEEEKSLFEERMRLQSYTIMRIEKLGNQMTPIEQGPADVGNLHFVKGQLIRTENNNLCVDSHQWDEIYAELSKGVYI